MSQPNLGLSQQQAIRAKCVHPSGTFIEFPRDALEQSIPQRFEEIARRYPNRIAVKDKRRSLSYAELDATANRLAHAVLERFGDANEPAAILVRHGAAALIAILGLLKTNKIYVPLDPSYPPARLCYMRADAGARLIVADRKHHGLAEEISGQDCAVVDFEELARGGPARAPGIAVTADALAYVLYTSGSTGQPKGVMENHRNVLHGTLRFTNGLHLCADDRLPLTHSCSSSASVRRIFPALLNGATLFPFNIKTDGMPALFDLIAKEQITVFSTGRIRDLVRAIQPNHDFGSLRLVSMGGESVHRSEVEAYRKIFPAHCIIGVWLSATETGNVTQFLLDRETEFAGEIVPIGYPAEDMEIILRDEARGVIVNGGTGEMAVRSRYLSPGYWRRPDLTGERFLVDSDDPTQRVYLSGDLGRFDADGCLIHCGRKDDQVKIRGHRVEVIETEAALRRLPGVKKAFVTVRVRKSSEQALTAYVVPTVPPAPTAAHLRNALAKTLPDFMIPSVFVMLDQLPLTPTGKVDRKALPEPDGIRPALDVAFAEPRTALERQLARIWAGVLGLDRIGVNDNFFDLGGHSLAAMRIVSRVTDRFKLTIPLQSLFQTPTIGEMASVIVRHQTGEVAAEHFERLIAEMESLSEQEAQERLAAMQLNSSSSGSSSNK